MMFYAQPLTIGTVNYHIIITIQTFCWRWSKSRMYNISQPFFWEVFHLRLSVFNFSSQFLMPCQVRWSHGTLWDSQVSGGSKLVCLRYQIWENGVTIIYTYMSIYIYILYNYVYIYIVYMYIVYVAILSMDKDWCPLPNKSPSGGFSTVYCRPGTRSLTRPRSLDMPWLWHRKQYLEGTTVEPLRNNTVEWSLEEAIATWFIGDYDKPQLEGYLSTMMENAELDTLPSDARECIDEVRLVQQCGKQRP